MNPYNQSCSNCLYWQPTLKSIGNGNCRFNPPVRLTVGVAEETKSFSPITSANWWCGQHAKATPEQVLANSGTLVDYSENIVEDKPAQGLMPPAPQQPVHSGPAAAMAPLAEVPASPVIQHTAKKKI